MAKISTNFFESILNGDKPMWNKIRLQPETATQCLAALVILLAELVDSINKVIEEPVMLYCIEIERELEKMCVLHHNFPKEPTKEEVLQVISDEDIGYDDNYGRIRWYLVKER